MYPTPLPKLLPVGYGLMNFTWVASRKFTPTQFNTTLKAVLDHSGASAAKPLFINAGEFYGVPDRHENLKLLGGYFDNFPEYADKVYVSVKSGVNSSWAPDTGTESLAKGVDAIAKYLEPLFAARSEKPKMLDMYTLARIGRDPIEHVVNDLADMASDDKFKSICLSEVSARTLAKAVAIAPIAAVEVEFSLFHREALQNGVFSKCAELDIPAVCYSPLGKGLLVGQRAADFSADDMRHSFDKFNNPEIFAHNEQLVSKVKDVAARLHLSTAQVALSWITTLSRRTHAGFEFPQLLPIPGSTNSDRQCNNLDVVELDDATICEIDEFLASFETKGHRYNKMLDSFGYR